MGALGLNDGEKVANSLANVTGFLSALAKDRHYDRCVGFRVPTDPEAHVDPLVLHALRGCGNVFEINRRAIGLPDDKIVVFVRGGQLTLRLEQEGAMRSIELSGAGIVGAILDGSCQVI